MVLKAYLNFLSHLYKNVNIHILWAQSTILHKDYEDWRLRQNNSDIYRLTNWSYQRGRGWSENTLNLCVCVCVCDTHSTPIPHMFNSPLSIPAVPSNHIKTHCTNYPDRDSSHWQRLPTGDVLLQSVTNTQTKRERNYHYNVLLWPLMSGPSPECYFRPSTHLPVLKNTHHSLTKWRL